jgi:hypothetical protein
MFRHGGSIHGRHHRRVFTGEACSLHPSAASQQAAAEAINYAFTCIHQGRLITPTEALMLAGAGAREQETLYSIACKFSRDENVDLRDVLCELGHRFPDYS